MTLTRGTLAFSSVVLLLAAAPAVADQTFSAESGKKYSADSVTIAQGEKLNFVNHDSVQHDVSSDDSLDGQLLFSSPLVSGGGSAPVDGTQYLKTGTYPFSCSIHPFMKGKLIVSSSGTVVPRPGSAVKPVLKVSSQKLSSLRKSGKLGVTLSGTPSAGATVTASATVSGKTVKLASRKLTIGASGKTKTSLKLSSASRKAIAKLKKLVVSFKATTTEGTPQTAKAKHTFS
jgi:plastocyanin